MNHDAVFYRMDSVCEWQQQSKRQLVNLSLLLKVGANGT